MTPLRILQDMRTLLTPPGAWTQGYYARNEYDLNVADLSPRAVKWCLLGAIGKVYGRALPFQLKMERDVLRLLKAALPEELGPTTCVSWFNDAPTTTHADILALLDRAILLAQKEAQS